jgi:cell division protein FtsW
MSAAAVQSMPSQASAKPWDKAPFDVVLLGAVLALSMLSIVMVYSSSAHLAKLEHNDSTFYVKRQIIYVLVGIGALATMLKIGYRELERWAYPLLALCGVLVFATFIPGIGLRVGGAQRWLRMPGFQLQPSEFAKIALCIYLARSVAAKGDALKDFKIGFVPHAMVFGLFGAMVLAQPDFGSTIVMFSMMMMVLFVAGARLRYVFVAFAAALPIVYELIIHSAYRMRRIEAFLDPFHDRFGASYQVAQALMSVGSGGLFGLGLGEGREKLGFLPAGHTDYILASIGEELGLVGIALTLGLFTLIIWRGVRAALRAGDAFGTYLAFGVTSLFAIETVINAGMCLALLPSKGLALPLLSFGGTSIVKAMLAAGILLSISGDSGGYLTPAKGATR